MKTPFVNPRFKGERFAGTLPLEVARDLAAYEELIVALAKHLFLQRNRARKRVPKGFDRGFSLHLEGMEEGSTTTKLASIVLATAGLFPPDITYFEQARDLVAECVRAKGEDKPLPATFPRKFLTYFNSFGISLREGEAVDIAPDLQQPALLTAARRKSLVLDAEGYYAQDVQLHGTIAKNEWETGKFTLRLLEGGLVDVVLPPSYREVIRQAAGNSRTLVSLAGKAQFNADDKIQSVINLTDLFAVPNLDLASAFEDALLLEPGWLDGEGEMINLELRNEVEDSLVQTYPEALPFPHVAPTLGGGIYLEWINSPWRVTGEFFPHRRVCELQATNARERKIEDYDLSLEARHWEIELYAFVNRFIASVWETSAE